MPSGIPQLHDPSGTIVPTLADAATPGTGEPDTAATTPDSPAMMTILSECRSFVIPPVWKAHETLSIDVPR
jgi:hypothetical protein